MNMTRVAGIAVVISVVGVLCGMALHTKKNTTAPGGAQPVARGTVPVRTPAPTSPRRVGTVAVPEARVTELPAAVPAALPRQGTAASSLPAGPAPAVVEQTPQIAFRRAIDCVASPEVPHEARVAAWKQLRESGWLDQAIGSLEQQAVDHPEAASYPAALGQAYLEKCGAIQDVREQGILAMKADQVFDTALNLDPGNWDARYMKALAMSYWPTQMNRGTEVMQHFVTLVEQQEAQAPQPHFAETYVRLGDEYSKYGHREHALEIWQRGAAQFPDDLALRAKLSAP